MNAGLKEHLYVIVSLVIYLNLLIFTLVRGKAITCSCTTHDCISQSTKTCTTDVLCFAQFLDRNDGSDPLIRGCIYTKTPLLCENMRPAIPGHWPVLVCCDQDMCNQEIVPTLPSWYLENGHSSDNETRKRMSFVKDVEKPTEEALPESDIRNRHHINSTVYISVLVVGIVLLIIIGITAICVLRRQQRFYTRQWSIDQGGYVKGHTCALPDLTAVDVGGRPGGRPAPRYSQIPLYDGIKTLAT